MYMPGRWRMWAASRRIWTLSGTYSADAWAAAWPPAACPLVFSATSVTMRSSFMCCFPDFCSTVFGHDPRAEAQVGYGGSRQAAAQGLQQPALVKVGELLQQHGVVNHHLQHPAAQGVYPRVFGR